MATRAHSGMSRPSRSRVDAHQHVEGAEPQVAHDLDALQRLDVGMHVAHPNALFVHVFGEVLGHALGEHGDERPVAGGRHVAAFGDQVVDLVLDRADDDRRVDEAGGADDLFGEHAAGAAELPWAGRCRDVDGLGPHGVPFLEAQRPVVDARRQPEAELGQGGLAVEVAAEHAAELRDGDVALVGEDQRVVGQVLEQRRRRLAGAPAGEIARIVLDAGAGAGRHHHLDVEGWCAAPGAGLRGCGQRPRTRRAGSAGPA
jgi:hypothetical protein